MLGLETVTGGLGDLDRLGTGEGARLLYVNVHGEVLRRAGEGTWPNLGLDAGERASASS